MRPVRPAIVAATLAALAAGLGGCVPRTGCLAGDDGECRPASACADLSFSCADTVLSIERLAHADQRPPGMDALAAEGDIVLRNDQVTVVIDDIGSPHHLAPTGGHVLDLAPAGGPDDLNQVYLAAGILPDDAVGYRELEIVDQAPDLVAVIARGELEGRPGVQVVTRYELRPCEPGLRIRSELHHGGLDPQAMFLADAWFWGDRESTPFVPGPGLGFSHPELSLLEIEDAFRRFPFVAAQAHGETSRGSAVAEIPCDRSRLEGFSTTTVSAVGLPTTIVPPGDALAFERFLAVAPGPGLAGAVDRALQIRGQLFGEPFARIRGRVVDGDGDPIGGDERAVDLVVSDAEPAEPRTIRTEIVPAVDGTFGAWVPAGLDLVLVPHVLGRPTATALELDSRAPRIDLGDVVVDRPGRVVARLSDPSGEPVAGEVVLTPLDAEDRDEHVGSTHGQFEDDACVPFLGPIHGSSPACNRVLLGTAGEASFLAPAGELWIYGTAGPFHTLARAPLSIGPGEEVAVDLVVEPLALLPAGSLSADLHVHAGASFDSSLPELDRARSFLAAGIDVVAATDHDVVTSYERAIDELGIADRVRVMPGVETTGLVLFFRPPGSAFPRTIGHYNFWPLDSDPLAPRNGAPADELLMPGELFDLLAPRLVGGGVMQLNHPFAEISFGRDQGFFSAVGWDPRTALPDRADATPGGILLERPGGGHRNLDHDVQEVMNGRSQAAFLQYRAGWFSLLSQGVLKGGTANSDTHTLAVEVLGYPRTIVFGEHALATLDVDAFNADLRAGRMVGTNGPVLRVSTTDDEGNPRGPALEGFVPATDAELAIEVSAAPWIPVEEVRVIVNGEVVWTAGPASLVHPTDPFGGEDLVRFSDAIPLDELLGDGDAWIVVEAGYALFPARDLDDDGLVDTTDNDGDGDIDADDRDGEWAETPFVEPTRPANDDDPRFHLDVVAPGTWPTAFSNPILVDVDGGGWEAPGR
jgi:hypothetical protein